MTYEQKKTEDDERKYHVFTDGSFIERRNAMGAAWMVVASDGSRQSEGVTRVDLSSLEEKGSSLIAEVMACSLALKQLADMIRNDTHHPQVIIHSDCTDLLNEIKKDLCQSAKDRFDAPALRTAFQELANDLDQFFHIKTKITHDESPEMRHVHDMATFATRRTSGKTRFIYNVDVASTIIDSSGPMHA
jgi:ribonuclease HI